MRIGRVHWAVDHVLRTTASPTQAGDWALVLAAAAIGHRVDEHDGHFALVVDAADDGRGDGGAGRVRRRRGARAAAARARSSAGARWA